MVHINFVVRGAVGERVVKGLLSRSGFTVRSYGVEYLAPELSSWIDTPVKNNKEYTSGEKLTKSLVQCLPDFVVHNKALEAYLVEAKFTSKRIEEYQLGDFLFPKAYVIVVSPFDVFLIHGSEPDKKYSLINDREKIAGKKVKVKHYGEQNYEARLDPFNISEELIKEALDNLKIFKEKLTT